MKQLVVLAFSVFSFQYLPYRSVAFQQYLHFLPHVLGGSTSTSCPCESSSLYVCGKTIHAHRLISSISSNVAFLISRRIRSLTAQNEIERNAVDLLIQDFANAHLKRWLHPFMNELACTANHPFYQMIARIGLILEIILIP